MRIALVSPHYPPGRSGVGDYTARLAHELVQAGHTVHVSTAEAAPQISPTPGLTVRSRPYPWHPARLGSIADDVRTFAPDAISVQYTPYLYSPKLYGIQPLLPAWIAWLRSRCRVPVALTAHERHYPAGFTTADRLLIGGPQWAIFRALAIACDHVFFTNECFRDEYRAYHPSRASRFSWLPVGANIEPSATSTDATRATATLLQFGAAHPTRLFDYSLEALRVTREKIPGARLHLIGPDRPDYHRPLPDGAVSLGYLRPAEVSDQLSRATLVVAPFLDGVSTRRGSVMAALAHGCPVVSNLGWATDGSVPWASFCELVTPSDGAEGRTAFAAATLRLATDGARRRILGAAGLAAYRERFDWPRLVSQMVATLESSSKDR